MLILWLLIATIRLGIPKEHEACDRTIASLLLTIPLLLYAAWPRWDFVGKALRSEWTLFAFQALNLVLWWLGFGVRLEIDLFSCCLAYFFKGWEFGWHGKST
jgi:hypothetical protein